MPARSTSCPPLRASVRWTAWALVAAVWLLNVLAASPQLHGAVHDHAGEAAHECAVTLFAHGADAPDAVPAFVSAPRVRALGRVAPPPSHEWTAPEHRLRPACGPPLC